MPPIIQNKAGTVTNVTTWGLTIWYASPFLALKIDCFRMLQPVTNVTDKAIDNCQDCPL